MRKIRFLLFALFALVGFSPSLADTVSPYSVDFNTAITTSNHDFAVASHWGHIVGSDDYDGNGPYYMSYSYSSNGGIDYSGTLLAYRQYAGDNWGGNECYDLLVTPRVSGEVKLYVMASISASSSNPAYVEFYSLNSAGTQKDALMQRFVAENFSDSDVEGWKTVTINVSTSQKIGIRAQHVYLDNFSATTADIVKEKKLTIKGVSSPTGQTPYNVNQNADGSADVQLVVKLQNSGDVDFVAGQTENYTLSPVKKAYHGSTETVYDAITFNIPENLAVGEEKDVTMTVNVPAIETGWLYWKVKENISGTVSSAQVQSQVLEYASKFIFDKSGTSYYSSPSATTTPISFGKITEAATVNYEIYNPGSAPLTINSFTVPAPFTTDAPAGEFTVASGEKKQIAISMPAGTPGVFTGNLAIEYTNYGKTLATYTLGISGTVVDPTKNWITFSNADNTNGQFPAGSIHADQVYITSKTDDGVTNYYLQSVNNITTKFVTPLLKAQAGEAFTYDAWYSSYSSSAAVKVYISTDRQNWTQIDNQTYSSGIGSTPKTFTVTIPDAGNYYLAFELTGNALLDNIYGLTLAATPAHDWYTIASDIPTKGKQNADYTATFSLQNIKATADVVKTARLYVGGEVVATVSNTSLAANTKTAAEGTGRNGYSNIEDPTTITFTYKPHTFGTALPAYIEVASDGYVQKTEVVNVDIAEEKIDNDVTISGNTTTNYVPIYGSWMDATGGSSTDFYYTKEQLTTSYGLKSGDKITAITFKGKGTAPTKTINSLTGKVWVAMENLADFTAGSPNKGSMTEVTLFNHETVTFTSGETKEFVIDLSAHPIVYDGESIIRFFTNFDGNGSWISITFPADNTYSNAWYGYGTSPSWSKASATPVASFSLAVEPTYFKGTVSNGTKPIAGANVKMVSNDGDDIQYAATTDTDGKFKISVVQDTRAYNVYVSAENYITDTIKALTFPAKDTVIVLELTDEEKALEAAKEALAEALEEAVYIDDYDKYTQGSVDALDEAVESANPVLANEDATIDEIKAALSKLLTALDGLTLIGDPDRDGKFTQKDVRAVADFVLGETQEVFNQEAADVNKNGRVSVSDAVLMVNNYVDATDTVAAARQPKAAAAATNKLTLNDVAATTKDKGQLLTVALENTKAITAFQMDIVTPQGVVVDTIELAGRKAANHVLLLKKQSDGSQRLVAYSPTSTAFADSTGALVNIKLSANAVVDDTVKVKNIELTGVDATEYDLTDVVTSGVKFELPTYTVTVVDSIENGTVTVSKTVALAGDTITVTATPAEGYKLDSLIVIGADTLAVDTLQRFVMPEANVTVDAKFALAKVEPVDSTYKFVAAEWIAGDAGRISPDKVVADAEANTITVSQTGLNNVALIFRSDKTYKVKKEQHYFVIRAKGLAAESGKSYLWWLNNTNNGGQYEPTATYEEEGETVFAWDVNLLAIGGTLGQADAEFKDEGGWSTTFGMTLADDAVPAVFSYIGFTDSIAEPVVENEYAWDATLWVAGDPGRISPDKVVVSEAANTITVSQTGLNNVALLYKTDEVLYVENVKYFVIQGTGLSTEDGKSYLWWLNNTNNGSQVAPNYVVQNESGVVTLVWTIADTGLGASFEAEKTYLVGNATWNTTFGLTLADDAVPAVISNISYEKEGSQIVSDAKDIAVGIASVRSNRAEDALYNLNGQKVDGTKKGLYIKNGKKVVLK